VKIEESVEKDGETSEIEELDGSDQSTSGSDALIVLNEIGITIAKVTDYAIRFRLVGQAQTLLDLL